MAGIWFVQNRHAFQTYTRIYPKGDLLKKWLLQVFEKTICFEIVTHLEPILIRSPPPGGHDWSRPALAACFFSSSNVRLYAGVFALNCVNLLPLTRLDYTLACSRLIASIC